MKLLENYKLLVSFLGEAMGENCKVVLYDLTQKKGQVIAIAGGTLEGQGIGAPLTDIARSFIKQEIWKEKDYVSNFLARTRDGKLMRSSTFFIKEDNRLIGLLCMNINMETYQKLSEAILSLSGLPHDFFTIAQKETASEPVSEAITNVTEAACAAIHELYGQIDSDRLTQSEKMEVIKVLKKKEIFLIKGAVSQISTVLKCSEASIYRYLSTINKLEQY